jgi:hypothetical protein
VQSGTPTLTTTLGTTYSGTFSGANAVLFADVSVLGPDFGFTTGDILVNPSLLGAPAPGSPPIQVLAFVSATGVFSLPISDPQRIVAFVGPTAAVPEPGTLMLLGLGLAAWRGARRLRPTSVERR